MSSFKLPEPLSEPPGALLGGLRESLMASLSLSMEDDDSNFIDVVDYLLSPDKDGCVSDRVIQKYLTLNPQSKEHLVEILKQLATTNVEDDRFADAVEPQQMSGTANEELDANEGRGDRESKQRAPRIGYVRVVGATPKAFQLLQVSNRVVEGVSILSNVPRYNEDSDYDDLPIISSYEEALKVARGFNNNNHNGNNNNNRNGRLEGAESASATSPCKKKKRKKRRNHKKRSPDADIELEIELDESEDTGVYREMYRIDETLELLRQPLQIPPPWGQADTQLQQQYAVYERLGARHQQQLQPRIAEKVPLETDDGLVTSSGTAMESSVAVVNALRPEALFDREFKFKSVSQQDTTVATWDELKSLVAEVFPHDSELKKAVDNKSQNSFELWKFVVKYGKMYKEFVSEVLEMVNELKKGLHEAMDMQRQKTNEILESHKKEMFNVVEKARIAENKIDLLELELDRSQELLDDQKVKIFGQDEELEKLQKEHLAKDKKLKDFDNVKKSLVVEKNRAKDDVKKLKEEIRELKGELDKERKSNDTLRGKARRETERIGDLEYKLQELENQHYDDQSEMENLQERNNVLTYKVDDLLVEIAHLKEKLAKQESLLKPPKPVEPIGRQQLSRSPPSEETSSCSSFGVFTGSSSSASSIESKTSFSGMSSAVESPKGCSPVPAGASRGQCTTLGTDFHSMLSPEVNRSAFPVSDPHDDVFECLDTARLPGSFSRTIRKGEGRRSQREAYSHARDVVHAGDAFPVNFEPAPPQNSRHLSPAYNPWGPSSFAGFSNTSLLGGTSACPTLFNIMPSSGEELSNSLMSICTAPPGLEGMNIGSGYASQGAEIVSPLASDLNNNLNGCTTGQSTMNSLFSFGNTTTNVTRADGTTFNSSIYSSGCVSNAGGGPTMGRRPPVRRSLDFSDLGGPFYT